MNREQLTALWRAPGVAQACHLTIWLADKPFQHRPGAPRKPTWDRALLKRAKRNLPNWYAMRHDPY